VGSQAHRVRLLHARLGDYLEELHPEDHGPHAQEGGQLGRKGQAQANDDGHFRVGGLGGGRIGDELIFELVRHRGSLHPGHQDKVLGPQHDRGRAVGGREDEAVTQKANDDRVRAEAGVLSTWKRKWQSEGTEGEHDVPRACTYIHTPTHTRTNVTARKGYFNRRQTQRKLGQMVAGAVSFGVRHARVEAT